MIDFFHWRGKVLDRCDSVNKFSKRMGTSSPPCLLTIGWIPTGPEWIVGLTAANCERILLTPIEMLHRAVVVFSGMTGNTVLFKLNAAAKCELKSSHISTRLSTTVLSLRVITFIGESLTEFLRLISCIILIPLCSLTSASFSSFS
ncbi:hypothetical protein PHET_04709 [Paragonimus heterotremus]|uniref:Uncharacterized protein n=1 Tax=Paragonimus heterotremus TaxID=100268 RepID=A0A8J4TBB9_9TREM|nr:hypothetical protein PHET_04709 [Paragonimus heterotremus]